MTPPIDGGVIVITGASAGIGRELARQLAPRAKRLILAARRADRLEALSDELLMANSKLDVVVRSVDVTDRAALSAFADELCGALGPVDVLVNNAGMGDFGCFDMSDWDKQEFLVELNVRAPLYLAHRLVPGMVSRGRGGVLSISSAYGLIYTPGFATYVGTKYFVTGFAETLRSDLSGTGVTATLVCPGPVATEFIDNVGNFTGMDVPKFVEITPEKCARQAIRGFERGRAVVVTGFIIRVVLALGAVTPKPLLRWVYGPIARLIRRTQRKALAERA